MDTNHQLIVRIRTLLNSNELVNSPTAQELYNTYKELNNAAASRLMECEVLLQRKQKIEAVVMVQQAPNLFELIDLLFFPERSQLLSFAELYDWNLPDEINEESLQNVKKAVSEMDNLRPLLTEFRRIARTDQVENKLHLLREITRIDKDNPEWKDPLLEVENQYLSRLIAEAQFVIQKKDLDRLEQIYEELKNSVWVVPIPTVVQQKIEKIVLQHRQKVAKEIAKVLLDKISSAYAAFDVTALDDALICWQDHCQKYEYIPDENESLQIAEASGYLNSEKTKLQAQKDFQQLLARVTALMDCAQPLDLVEMYFARAQAMEYEIPEYLTNRVARYRSDMENRQKTATLIRSLKITGIIVGFLFVIGLTVHWVFELKSREEAHDKFNKAIIRKDLTAARSILKDNERLLAKSGAKGQVQELEAEEKERKDKFESLAKEINKLLDKEGPPDRLIEKKLADIEVYRGKDEKEEEDRLNRMRVAAEDKTKKWKDRVNSLFDEKRALFEQRYKRLKQYSEEKRFGDMEQQLSEMKKTLDEIGKIREWLSPDNKAMYDKYLETCDNWEKRIGSERERQRAYELVRKSLLEADNFSKLEEAVRRYALMQIGNNDSERKQNANACLDQIDYFRAIISYMNVSRNAVVPEKYKDRAFFKDVATEKERNKKFNGIRDELITNLKELYRNTGTKILSFVRVRTGTEIKDLYLQQSSVSGIYHNRRDMEISGKREDGVNVKMRGTPDNFTLEIGNEKYSDCQLIYPKVLQAREIKKSGAQHRKYSEELFHEVRSLEDVSASELLRKGIGFLKKLHQKDMCSPYWKMIIALQIAEPLSMMDLSPDQELVNFKKELDKLRELNNEKGSSLNNKFLADSITNFFKHYDFSKLDNNLQKNETILNFYKQKQSCSIRYLGFTMYEKENRTTGIVPDLKNKKISAVYCFDSKISSFLLIGSYSANGLVIHEPYRDQLNFHLLFIADPADGFEKIYGDLMKISSGLDLQKIQWPAFWPENRKGYPR